MKIWLSRQKSNQKCNDCNEPGFPVVIDGYQVGPHMCQECWKKLVKTFDEKREQFEALLENGVDKRMANRIMIARDDRETGKK